MTTTPTSMSVDDALARLAEASGQSIDDLRRKLAKPVPEIGQHAAERLRSLPERTRDTYSTHIDRFLDGVGPVCDQTCEPCLDPVGGFTCRCECSRCAKSRITVPPLRQRPVDPTTLSFDNANNIASIAERMAIKRGIVENRRRAARGKSRKKADGQRAKQTAVSAMRWLYETGTEFVPENAAKRVEWPKPNDSERRPLADFELLRLRHVTATGGDDPELDELIFDIGMHTGARREGTYLLKMSSLDPVRQMITVNDKGKRPKDMPVSAELLARLTAHAIGRGGTQCDPTSPGYRPDAPVLWYKNGRPLTDRRFDTLINRWHKSLDWANAEHVGFHHIRHTMAAFIGSLYGPNYKKRYLRHEDGDVTSLYGQCTIDMLAWAMSDLLDYEHPLVQGRSDRRRREYEAMGIVDVEPDGRVSSAEG